MKKINDNSISWRYGFAIFLIVLGLIFSYLNVGVASVGNFSTGFFLIFVGFIMMVAITIQLLRIKQKIVIDERLNLLVLKASRITFMFIVLCAFFIIIIDSIEAINLSYRYFMSYFISGMVFVYFLVYKILERFN